MKNNCFIFILFSMVTALGFTSCDDYLDENPDNRAELNTKEKISSWLTSAYPKNSFIMMSEMASDNMDRRVYPSNVAFAYKNQEDCFWWGENTDKSGNDSPTSVWNSYYKAIDVANRAIDAIDKLGNPADLQPQRGEALIIRAYCHFILVNLFSLHYNEASSQTDLGIPYLDNPNITLNPQFSRGTVAEVYDKIEKDIEAGIPLIDDNAYAVAPKYHFNRRAANALASRFYLYYGKYDKAIEYSNRALGDNLDKILRNMSVYTTMNSDIQIRCREWVNPGNDCNFLIMSHYSALGQMFANYSTGSGGKLYQHSYAIAFYETFRGPGPWREAYNANDWYLPALSGYASGYVIYYKTPYIFEYTDLIARTGYAHTISTAFTADEVLLNRAEAYIVKGEYDKALSDLDRWMKVYIKSGVTLTRELVNSFYGNMDYYKPQEPTLKKAIHPLNFTIASPEQENFIQCLLHFRRIETVFLGLRWFDVKRFGIEIYRRDVSYVSSTKDDIVDVTDVLKLDDPRRAIQIPSDAISAGVMPNPR